MKNRGQKSKILSTSSMFGQSKGQVTIFIIIAIILVGSVIAFFTIRNSLMLREIPVSIEPVYTSFLACLQDDTLTGIEILEGQGGYIELPEFEPGSAYMPFSSQLNFLGNPIPYWYYVSGNNIQKEQIPSKKNMEDELGDFIEDKIRKCVFNSYYDQGFEIIQGDPNAKVNIKASEVEVNLNMDLSIVKGEDSTLVRDHEITVGSNLGKLYDSAKTVYEKEQDTLFLEEYAIDTLRLYAPVDGVELTCSPLVWNADEVFDELQEAIEVNTLSLRTRGRGEDYFLVDIPIDEDVRFINSKEWPNSFEVIPSEEVLLIANPVGNQPGLGALGFCYVPYHFVYSVRYPVLVQVYSGEEIFQFPLAVVIQNNNPRESLEAEAIEQAVPELCKFKNTQVKVNTLGNNGDRVEAEVYYECFGTKCTIGKTSAAGILEEDFPQCVNGYVIARAEGFEDARYLFSTVESGSIDVILDKLHSIDLDLKLDSVPYNGDAIINFVSGKVSRTIVYPDQKTVELSEGQYEIQVYIYTDSEVTIGATTTEQCIKVPRGVLGVFGLTKEKCFDIEVPEQIISTALSGGGKQNYYASESELSISSVIEIGAESLPSPETIEQLQINHLLFETKDLDITFK